MILPMSLVDPAAQAPRAASSCRQDFPSEGAHGEVEAVGEDSHGRLAHALPRPKFPSEEARRRHELSHGPYANWCRYCVIGPGQEAHHRRQGALENAPPVTAMDYCFLGTEGLGSEMATTLVVRDSVSSYLGASCRRHCKADPHTTGENSIKT